MSRYAPTDSPFGDAYCDFLAHEFNPGTSAEDTTLDAYSLSELDEFASCAESKLRVPIYADDPSLIAFVAACRALIERQSLANVAEQGAYLEALYRTPEVRRVLSAVRVTGRSAHPQHGEGFVSPLVRAVAAELRMSAVGLQVQVNAYADAQREHIEARALLAAYDAGRALRAAGV